ncbi:MAG: ferredoxin, partial [Acidimicrobiia bacterium]|nr:ferredoxin [Acidimicrobiia bacterium]
MTTTRLMVWIDQDLCTGDGICEEIAPDVFVGRDDGLWVVKEEARHFDETIVFDAGTGPGHGPEGSRGVARVPDKLIEDVIESAEECPGECIMIEPYNEAIMRERGV